MFTDAFSYSYKTLINTGIMSQLVYVVFLSLIATLGRDAFLFSEGIHPLALKYFAPQGLATTH